MHLVNTPCIEHFTVTDQAWNLVPGLVDGDFTRHLFDPTGTEVTGSFTLTITALGNGHYITSFTPTSEGQWYQVVYHAVYFPWGKAGTIQIDHAPDAVDALYLKKAAYNKKTLTKISDTEYVEVLFDDDRVTPIRTMNITKVGDVETRVPVP